MTKHYSFQTDVSKHRFISGLVLSQQEVCWKELSISWKICTEIYVCLYRPSFVNVRETVNMKNCKNPFEFHQTFKLQWINQDLKDSNEFDKVPRYLVGTMKVNWKLFFLFYLSQESSVDDIVTHYHRNSFREHLWKFWWKILGNSFTSKGNFFTFPSFDCFRTCAGMKKRQEMTITRLKSLYLKIPYIQNGNGSM